MRKGLQDSWIVCFTNLAAELFLRWNRRNWWKRCSASRREGRVARRRKRRFALNGTWTVALVVGEGVENRIDR